MKNTKLLLLACLMTLIGWNATAQRVIAYHQGTNNDKLQSWYWDYITDVNYSFLQVGSSGQVGLGAGGASDSFQEGLFNTFLAQAKAQGKRITISVGGADKVQAANFKTAASTDTKASTLANNVVNWAKAKGLDGVDLDWEPEGSVGVPTSAEWIRLLSAFRTATSAANMEFTAAIFPYKWNNDFITPASHQYVDHFNLMIYDFGSPDYEHHSDKIPNADNLYGGKTVEEACVSYWNTTKGLDKTKMVLGLPFYARSAYWAYSQSDYKLYRDVLALGGSATADSQGNWRYNGQTTIKRKTKYAIDNGLKGVMMWEIAGDATTKANSLLAAIDEEITAAGCPKPDLGDDQNICSKAAIELDASLPENDYTFEWQKNNTTVFGTGRKLNVTAPGTYKVIATKKGTACSQENVIIIEGTYPEIEVLDVPLCGAGDEITVDGTIVDFENMTYKWTGPKTSNAATIAISQTGTYTLEVSDPEGHCATKSKSIEASESSVTIQGDTVCAPGDEAKVKVLDPGTYSWWDAVTGGTQLGTEDSLYQVIAENTTFYVQKTGGAVQYDLGLKYDHAAQEETWNGPGKGDYEYAASGFDDIRLYFTALQELTIDEANVHMDLGSGSDFNGTFDVCLYDGDKNEIECKEVFLEANGKGTIALGFTVQPGNYYLGIPNAKQWVEKGVESSPLDYANMGVTDVITLNTTVSKNTNDYDYAIGHWYAGFYDMKISTGKPCPRVPVTAIIDENNVKCVNHEPIIKITKPTDKQTFEVQAGNIDLIATATDQDSEIDKVEFTLSFQGNDLPLATSVSGSEYSAVFQAVQQAPGTFVFTATVTTKDGQTATDQIEFTLSNGNQSPTITITSPTEGSSHKVNTAMDLTVNAQDDNAVTKVIYQISKDGQVIKSIESTTSPFSETYTPAEEGSYTVKATAFDAADLNSSDEVAFTVVSNQEPVVTITSPNNGDSFDINSTINLAATATDADGNIVSVIYTVKYQGQDVEIITGSGSNYTGSFVADKAGDYTIIAKATDNENAIGVADVTITVNADKVNPTITITSPNDGDAVEKGNVVNLTADATDTDGNVTSVEYVITLLGQTVTQINGSGSNYTGSFTPLEEGTYTITATATDNDNLIATDVITITVTKPNEDPVITVVEPANTSIKLPNAVNFDANVTDDGSIQSVTIAISGNGVNDNVSVSNSGSNYTGSWTPTNEGTYTATITATDNQGAVVTKTVTITILAIDADLPPTIVINKPTTDVVTILTTESVDIDATITDDNAVASVTIDGATITGSGSTYTSTYSNSNPGTYQVEIVAVDDKNNTSTKTITIIVEKPNEGPIVVINKPTNGQTIEITNSNNTIAIEATVTDDKAVNSVVIKVNGQTVSVSNNGNIYSANYTATTGGQVTIEVIATDSDNVSTTESVTITIEDKINNDAVITINSPTTTDNISIDNNAVNVDISATDSEGVQSVTVTAVNTTTNTTTNITTSTTNGKTTGTWNPTEEGTYTIQVTVTDNKGNTTVKTLTIVVKGANELPVITLNEITSNGVAVNSSLLIGAVIDLSATVSHSGDPINNIFYEIKDEQGNIKQTLVGNSASNFAKSWTANSAGTWTIVAKAVDPDDNAVVYSQSQTVTIKLTNGLAEDNAAQLNFIVAPNPAIDEATISFELIESAETIVSIYNVQGQVISTVVNDELAAGTHTVEIEVSDIPSGVYFIQLVTGDTLAIQRLIVK